MQIGKISKFFSFDPLPFSQRGLEGKKPTFRVSRGPEEEERKEKKLSILYGKLSCNILIQIVTHICPFLFTH
jgi:hypothetical protein